MLLMLPFEEKPLFKGYNEVTLEVTKVTKVTKQEIMLPFRGR